MSFQTKSDQIIVCSVFYSGSKQLTSFTFFDVNVFSPLHIPQIRKSWDSMENANKKESSDF